MIGRLALVILALSLSGCLVRVYDPRLELSSDVEGWHTEPGLSYQADAAYRDQRGELTVSARADDPYTPVRLRVRPADAAIVTVSRPGNKLGVAGAWRLGDRAGHYLETRVPRALEFGTPLHVPAGADLLIEFDPAAVCPDASLSEGDTVAIDVRIASSGSVETIPVRLSVTERDRKWYIGLAGH